MRQLATTIEQSQHLLDLGLSADTADMCFDKGTDLTKAHLECDNFITYFTNDEYPEVADRYVPAWSLGALLELMPNGYVIKKNYAGVYYSESLDHKQTTRTYNTPLEAAFNMIVWLLENGYIKKGE